MPGGRIFKGVLLNHALAVLAEFGFGVCHLLNELAKRDIAPPAAAEKFLGGLKTLMDTFGGSEALRQTIANARS